MREERVQWRGIAALRCSAGGTSVVVVPGRGAKLVSLRDRTGREWLAQGDGRPVLGDPATAFEDAEMCGWDECIPTIDRSRTTTGLIAPDHGDAWNRAWEESPDGALSTHLPSVDATFERGIGLEADGTLTLSYRVKAGPAGADILWAAHPLFLREAGDRIRLDAAKPLWDVSAPTAVPAPGDPGERVNAPMPKGASAKYYTDPEERPRWARIDRRDGASLRLEWEGRAVRTLGVWLDRSRFATEDVVAFEPSTGWYDSVDAASAADRVLRVGPGGTAEWSLVVRLTAS
ncbi:hypothetical protein RS83_00507 [Microbacterium oxydans]|uniref:Aldose 1-epimerase n=1 Tax=Microbacterium oxydans TaxID=82380 RepID=A0A0F0LHM8_9MICO|nr:hypothetical protein RS83_00507 [Microbacterium oxydans]